MAYHDGADVHHFEELSGPNAFFRSFFSDLGLAVAGVTLLDYNFQNNRVLVWKLLKGYINHTLNCITTI